MSAFVVSNEHINALVNFGIGANYFDPVTKCTESITRSTAERVGQILWDENQRSVNYRYHDTEHAPVFKFRPNGYGHFMTAVQIIKLCHGLDYQSCETDDWPQTVAHSILRAIECHAIYALPGYEAADWSID